MARRKIVSIPGLPQLPVGSDDEARYETDLLRVLWAWKRSLDQLIDENNTGEEGGGGHIIQEEGVDLPDQDRLNFIGASVTAADDPANGATTVTVTGGGGASGTVTSITATSPIVVTPSPITTTGDVSHAASGVSPGTYGDITNIPQITVNATGHVTAVVDVAVPGGGGLGWLWGSGLDGVVHFNGTNTFSFATKTGSVYVLERSVHATNCTIDSGVTVMVFDYAAPGVGGGQQIFCQDTFTCNGHYNSDGQRNTVNLNSGGLGTPSGVNGIYDFGSNGGASNGGAAGAAGVARSNGFGGNGGAGGASTSPNNGGAGGVVSAASAPEIFLEGSLYLPFITQLGRIPKQSSPFWELFGGGAGGGGGGGVTVGVYFGGGGGGGGGVLGLFARLIAGTGRVSCDGAAGNIGSWSSAGGGGGGGGGGGLLMVITTQTNWDSLVTASVVGGLGGAATSGVSGSAGSVGKIVRLIVS